MSRSETELRFAIYRTQLFDPSDLDNVKAVQAGYQAQPLSAFLGQPAPEATAAIDFIAPLTPDAERTSPEMRTAIEQGMADALAERTNLKARIDAGEFSSGGMFGTREYLQNNYAYRMAAAVLGIYGNSNQEAVYPIYTTDAEGQLLNAATGRYALRFAPGQLPPVNAFWSLTMYELPSSLLSANPLNRYLLNSPMLPQFTRDADGGLTFLIQHESPGRAKEANWLPAPNGRFFMVLRLYWPKKEVLEGTWTAPLLTRAP